MSGSGAAAASAAAGEQQFCLKWNNHRSTILSVFDTLLEEESLVDVTLSAEGQFLRAHRVILSACSPYFRVGHYDSFHFHCSAWVSPMGPVSTYATKLSTKSGRPPRRLLIGELVFNGASWLVAAGRRRPPPHKHVLQYAL